MPESPSFPVAQGKPWLSICVTRDDNYLVKGKKQEGSPPNRIFMPWADQNDPRFFVRNGELIKPYGIVEFAFQRMESCPELDHDRACYKEVGRTDFDPAGCVPITYFDIAKVEAELNAGTGDGGEGHSG